ncbi:hypothetical protein [Gloeocapsopsis dulcis]|uniref:Uncharacterized protein n=1 Tax=Gloeocapsopsis dulcis AAB1 = 1H9 TaxID=1433147 RepID=A0A6N8G239_9CHRO|nr:hypothetical protein [Gloeocapsopsis dulcis]MUL39251.1 hypothetical protein [Gloeocapsopsis dulcis AAB1 = 1H9]WNN90863.1 hypothetical protein P0S91_07255 [Gloeocapsopsis dulcis]
MQGHKLNHNSLLAERNFSNLTYTEINQNTAPPNQVNIPNTSAFWGSLGLLTGGVIFLSMLSKLRKQKQSDIVINLQQLNKIPCSNCRFFSSNPYLKCAVNPTIALTEEAINCTDYCPQAKKIFH